jgi:hypothetical protein
VREDVWERVQDDLSRGTVFFDINAKEPRRLDVFSAAIRDGSGNILHRRLFVVQTEMTGAMTVRQPTLFLDLVPTQQGSATPDDSSLPDLARVEHAVVEDALQPFLEEISVQREKEISTIAKHVEISLNALIDRQNLHMAELLEQQQKGDASPLLAANIKTTEDRLDELNGRLERRRVELKQERHCTISDIRHHGRAWVLPHGAQIQPGKKQTYVVRGVDQYGQDIAAAGVERKATGGTIDREGVFTAAQDEGSFAVTASSGAVKGSAMLDVVKPGSKPPLTPRPPATPGALRWTGEIPAQKWMNFYTKVLSKFAGAQGLKLILSIEVSPEGGISAQRIEETRMALQELGLTSSIETY